MASSREFGRSSSSGRSHRKAVRLAGVAAMNQIATEGHDDAEHGSQKQTSMQILRHQRKLQRRNLYEEVVRCATLEPPLRGRFVTCEEAMTARDGRWLMTAELVLVRQKPGSAKDVMYLTIEDETGPANVVVWPKLFEKLRRIVLGSSMMAISGRIQREGEVLHLIAQQLFDLSADLSGLADRDEAFRLPTGRGDEFAHGAPGSPDSRERAAVKQRDIFIQLCRIRHNAERF
ncbi:nucleic acid binding OB-fold domain-containing protein (plasmid) [Rhizobium gallicum]|uniref:Nucleic acid binding OB-fold domain-containing protein n=1 Tax=Rhizobium gallicum TaxID=56730 RepID=A0A1L5NR90_9HYPH|nr:nucleic acid binding OB-fold domain-containing protein [Rhizobium gallicum]